MPARIEIATARLLLVGADAALLNAELAGREVLGSELGVTVPSHWPPKHMDEPAIRWMLALVERLPTDAPWRMYYILLPGTPSLVIGTCGYKGLPDTDGAVEIGYSVLNDHWRCGYASEAASALVASAWRHGAQQAIAETYPALTASRRVMEKCGMVLVGQGSEAGVIRYAVEKSGRHE